MATEPRDLHALSGIRFGGNPVRILSDQVVNQIAAGEVVERPVSVVKELVENSIDAGAREVTVTISNGGQSSIIVVDDGSGMSRGDALNAIKRFGTSKVSSVEDLFALETHGFRGEALPSIASVSRFELSTAPRGPVGGVGAINDASPGEGSSPGGIRISVEGGTVTSTADASLPPGTRVEVRSLFYNVPARRKFLRTEATEGGLIRALMIDFSLAYPDIRFRLVSDGVQTATYPAGGDIFRRAIDLGLAGKSPLRCEYQVATAAGPVIVRAILSQPIEAVASSSRLRLLVNNRSVRDKMLLKAVRDGYGNFLRPGRYPAGVLSLSLPPEDVDVNVHPQKAEVRFRRPEVIFGVVTKAVQQGLRQTTGAQGAPGAQNAHDAQSAIGGADGSGANTVSVFESQNSFVREGPVSWSHSVRVEGVSAPMEVRESAATSFAFHPVSRTRRMRYVGQLLRCYLVFEGEGSVALVDMHAAHERVMFYRLKSQLLGGAVHSQMLLLPESVTLQPEMFLRFESVRDSFERFGFTIEPLGEHTVVVRAIPALLASIPPAAIVVDLLSHAEELGGGAGIEDRVDAVIARLACHRSIRSGRELEPAEAYELLESLEQADASGYCPHGRPVIRSLSERDLESMFGRV